MENSRTVAAAVVMMSICLCAVARAGEGDEAAPNYIFHFDWTSSNTAVWRKHLAGFVGKPGVQGLEIGCFEGRSSIWFAENILTHPTAHMTCIDVFSGNMEERFDHNIAVSPVSQKVTKLKGYSQDVLRGLEYEAYDFIYIDGCHLASCVLTDIVMAWDLLKTGAVIIFDDYRWKMKKLPPSKRPKIAIDSFVAAFADRIAIVADTRGQLVVKKTAGRSDKALVGNPIVRLYDGVEAPPEPEQGP
jgi:predicted O-methyltransferase YrrM